LLTLITWDLKKNRWQLKWSRWSRTRRKCKSKFNNLLKRKKMPFKKNVQLSWNLAIWSSKYQIWNKNLKTWRKSAKTLKILFSNDKKSLTHFYRKIHNTRMKLILLGRNSAVLKRLKPWLRSVICESPRSMDCYLNLKSIL
jgi:hypothetical protein